MATYKQVQANVLRHYGFKPRTCWIAHVKEMSGLPVKRAWNRRGPGRKVPCPPRKAEPIWEALRQLGEPLGE